MKTYEKYKNSGVEWIGDIPENWEVRRLKYIAKIYTGTTPKSSNPKFYKEEINWFTPSDLKVKNLKSSNRKISNLAINLRECKLFNENSVLLVSIGGTLGKVSYSLNKFCCNQQINVIGDFRVCDYKFVFYYISIFPDVLNNLAIVITLPILNQSRLKDFFIPFVPLQEQQKIASFLDDKSQKIEQFIKNKQRLIELLEEEKKTLITQAVTKGINPDVNYKNSGVEWIGDIPEYWEIRKLKFCVDLVNNQKTINNRKYIGLENIESWTGKIINLDINIEVEGVSKNFKKGNVLFSKLRPYLAKAFIADFSGICTSELLVFKAKLFNKYFLLNLFLTSKFISLIDSSTYGSKMPRANWNFIGNILVSIPPLNEQKQIVNYIEEKSQQIDELKAKYQQEIDLINEYKERLCYDAVTGKIKIP